METEKGERGDRDGVSKRVDRRYGIEPLERIYPLAPPDRKGRMVKRWSFSFARTRYSVSPSLRRVYSEMMLLSVSG